jgi:hypothetical protein
MAKAAQNARLHCSASGACARSPLQRTAAVQPAAASLRVRAGALRVRSARAPSRTHHCPAALLALRSSVL